MYENPPTAVRTSCGEDVHFFRVGKPGATPVVLLHGLSQQADFWIPTLDFLRSRDDHEFDFLVLDQRGHGYSQGFSTDHDLSISSLAHDVIAVLDHLDIHKALVVGHSMGAMVAVMLAANHPNKVAASILVDGGVRMPSDGFPPTHMSREDLVAALTPPEGPFSASDLTTYYGGLDPANSDKILAAVTRTYTPIGQKLFVSTLGMSRHMQLVHSILDFDTRATLERVQTPVWALMCQQDIESIDFNSALWARLVNHPHMQIQHWYGYEHDIPLQRPSMISSMITAVARTCFD